MDHSNPWKILEHAAVMAGVGWAWMASVPWANVAAFCAVCYYVTLGGRGIWKAWKARKHKSRRATDRQ